MPCASSSGSRTLPLLAISDWKPLIGAGPSRRTADLTATSGRPPALAAPQNIVTIASGANATDQVVLENPQQLLAMHFAGVGAENDWGRVMVWGAAAQRWPKLSPEVAAAWGVAGEEQAVWTFHPLLELNVQLGALAGLAGTRIDDTYLYTDVIEIANDYTGDTAEVLTDAAGGIATVKFDPLHFPQLVFELACVLPSGKTESNVTALQGLYACA